MGFKTAYITTINTKTLQLKLSHTTVMEELSLQSKFEITKGRQTMYSEWERIPTVRKGSIPPIDAISETGASVKLPLY